MRASAAQRMVEMTFCVVHRVAGDEDVKKNELTRLVYEMSTRQRRHLSPSSLYRA